MTTRISLYAVIGAGALVAGMLSGCISSSSPPPPAKTTVVVPPSNSTTVVCQNGNQTPCD